MESLAPLASGFLAGVASTSLLLPLDVVKVRLQVHEGHGRRLRFLRALGGILKYEGVGGLYAGWAPAVLGSAVAWGGYFYVYEAIKPPWLAYKQSRYAAAATASAANGEMLHTSSHTNPVILESMDHFVLACAAGAVMVGLTNPIWLVKTRMQLQLKRASLQQPNANIRPYLGVRDALQTIMREEGFFALYKGSGAALLLTSHGGVQFVVYEYLRRHFHYQRASRSSNSNNSSTSGSVWERLECSTGYLAMGATSKMIASTVTYPLQVVKSRQQQRSHALEFNVEGQLEAVRRDYSGFVATMRRIGQAEGMGGFFKGCLPNAIRVAPGAAITFVVYEGLMDILSPSALST
jgi:solute carrier family 25 folate transporter 32